VHITSNAVVFCNGIGVLKDLHLSGLRLHSVFFVVGG
jgi:hypothetical protein